MPQTTKGRSADAQERSAGDSRHTEGRLKDSWTHRQRRTGGAPGGQQGKAPDRQGGTQRPHCAHLNPKEAPPLIATAKTLPHTTSTIATGTPPLQAGKPPRHPKESARQSPRPPRGAGPTPQGGSAGGNRHTDGLQKCSWTRKRRERGGRTEESARQSPRPTRRHTTPAHQPTQQQGRKPERPTPQATHPSSIAATPPFPHARVADAGRFAAVIL